jgi:hypothetical protein
MSFVIQVLCRASRPVEMFSRRFIAGYRDTPCGRGEVTFVYEVDGAKRFADRTAAFAFWKTQSRTMPRRPDGKPNRPMTAYTVEIFDPEAP